MNQRPKTTTTPIGFVIRGYQETLNILHASENVVTKDFLFLSCSLSQVTAKSCSQPARARPPISGGFTPQTPQSPSGPFTTKNIYSTSSRTTKQTTKQADSKDNLAQTVESTLQTKRFRREQRAEGVRRVAIPLINPDSPSGSDTIRHLKSRHRSHSIGVDVTALFKILPAASTTTNSPLLSDMSSRVT